MKIVLALDAYTFGGEVLSLFLFSITISISIPLTPQEALWCAWAKQHFYILHTPAPLVWLWCRSFQRLAFFSKRSFLGFHLFISSQDRSYLDLFPFLPFFWPFSLPISFSCRSQRQSWESLSSRRTHGSSHWYVWCFPLRRLRQEEQVVGRQRSLDSNQNNLLTSHNRSS